VTVKTLLTFHRLTFQRLTFQRLEGAESMA